MNFSPPILVIGSEKEHNLPLLEIQQNFHAFKILLSKLQLTFKKLNNDYNFLNYLINNIENYPDQTRFLHCNNAPVEQKNDCPYPK